MSEKAQRVVSMRESRHSLLSILHLNFLQWMPLSKSICHMLRMESTTTIGMTTFWAHWSSFEWQPLMCCHPLDKLFNVFCASSNSHKTSITSHQIGFFKIFGSRICWYSRPFMWSFMEPFHCNFFYRSWSWFF